MADAGLIARAAELDAKIIETDAMLRAASASLSEADIARMEGGIQAMQSRAEWYRQIAQMEPERAMKFMWVLGGGFFDKPEFWPKEYRPTKEQIAAHHAQIDTTIAKIKDCAPANPCPAIS